MKTDRVLMNEHEAAKMLNKAVQSLRNDRHNRRGVPYVKLGRLVRYIPTDIVLYIKARRISFDK